MGGGIQKSFSLNPDPLPPPPSLQPLQSSLNSISSTITSSLIFLKSNNKQYKHSFNIKDIYNLNQSSYELLSLTEEDIYQLYKGFLLIDQQQVGLILSSDIIHYLKIQNTKFINKIFLVLNYENNHNNNNDNSNNNNSNDNDSINNSNNNNNKINFFQFVIACWSLCTLNQRDYSLYLFELYDLEEIGFIDVKTAQQILEDIYGDSFYDDLLAQRFVFLFKKNFVFKIILFVVVELLIN